MFGRRRDGCGERREEGDTGETKNDEGQQDLDECVAALIGPRRSRDLSPWLPARASQEHPEEHRFQPAPRMVTVRVWAAGWSLAPGR